MKLTINGEARDLDAATLAEALVALGMGNARVATALNGDFGLELAGYMGRIVELPDAGAVAALHVVGIDLELGLGELLDVDVLERDHPDLLDEARRAVHVPDPRIGHANLVVDLAARITRNQLHGISQVETAFGLHHIGKLANHVAVFAVHGQLDVCLVVV